LRIAQRWALNVDSVTEMAEAAARLEFERAALLRDQINALKSGDYRKAAKAGAASEKYPTRKPPRSRGGRR